MIAATVSREQRNKTARNIKEDVHFQPIFYQTFHRRRAFLRLSCGRVQRKRGEDRVAEKKERKTRGEGRAASNFGGVETRGRVSSSRSSCYVGVSRASGTTGESFSKRRGQPRPARRGQQREVEVRFGAPGVATSRTEPPESRDQNESATLFDTIEFSKRSNENEFYHGDNIITDKPRVFFLFFEEF